LHYSHVFFYFLRTYQYFRHGQEFFWRWWWFCTSYTTFLVQQLFILISEIGIQTYCFYWLTLFFIG
jgi:hypothetical protein